MDKYKRFILPIIILIIMLLVIIIILIYATKILNDKKIIDNEEVGGNVLEGYAKGENGGISWTSYFDINYCIDQYLQNLNIEDSRYYGFLENGGYGLIIPENEIKQNIYNLLSKTYITKNNITIDNVYDYVKCLNDQAFFVPLKVKILQDNEIKSFLIKGLIEDLEMQVIDEVIFIVNIDSVNDVFSIEPINEKNVDINEISISGKEEKIESNNNNSLDSISISNENIIRNYINIYKRLAFGNPEILYDLLNEEYKEKRFGNIDEFKKFLEKNKKKIIGTRIEKYQYEEYQDYNQYACVDQYENYYIFREKGVLDYSIILDTYTIDLPEFIEKYKNLTDEKRCLINIQKIVDAVNMGDYKYIYSKLDSIFKNTKFSKLSDLEEYVKSNFFENNKIKDAYILQQGNVYTYRVILNENTNTLGEKEFDFIMQLVPETDFAMSFSKK